MVFKNFRWKILARIILIGLIMSGLGYAVNQDRWYVTSGALVIAALLLLIELFLYVEKTRRTLGKFLLSIKQHDFNQSFVEENKEFLRKNSLEKAFLGIIDEFQQVRIEKEIHYQFLQTIIENIDVAIICIDYEEQVILINDAAKKVLGVQHVKSLEQILKRYPDMKEYLENIPGSEQKRLKIKVQGIIMQLAVKVTSFIIKGERYKLVSLQDIKSELESQELESWQRLIRVLTHEIMNSVTPISSLSTALNEILKKGSGDYKSFTEIGEDDAEDIRKSVNTIHNRSIGLLSFVKTYKDITRLPEPRFENIDVRDLITHVQTLLTPEIEGSGVALSVEDQDTSAEIHADHDMIVRVLINLVLNAVDAVDGVENPSVRISWSRNEEPRVFISVKDNGCGMDRETLDNIFVPFFTTKKDGSGIGLSLSRQIMHLHKGNIYVETEPGVGTTFSLQF
jgi:nitrogen fixation/metabolism regulation signal transduction histidine kinase